MRYLALLTVASFPLQAQITRPAMFTTTGAFFAVSVPNLAEARAWYTDKLGLNVTGEPAPHEGITAVILQGGGLIVELLHDPAAAPRPAGGASQLHGIFKVGIVLQDYDAAVARMRERGVPFAFGPFPARMGQRANFAIRDPAGNLIQFFGP